MTCQGALDLPRRDIFWWHATGSWTHLAEIFSYDMPGGPGPTSQRSFLLHTRRPWTHLTEIFSYDMPEGSGPTSQRYFVMTCLGALDSPHRELFLWNATEPWTHLTEIFSHDMPKCPGPTLQRYFLMTCKGGLDPPYRDLFLIVFLLLHTASFICMPTKEATLQSWACGTTVASIRHHFRATNLLLVTAPLTTVQYYSKSKLLFVN